MITRASGSSCSRCGAPIRFVQLESGKSIAVDAIATVDGNLCAFGVPGTTPKSVVYVRGYMITAARPARHDGVRFTVHQATGCREDRRKPMPPDFRARLAAARAEHTTTQGETHA